MVAILQTLSKLDYNETPFNYTSIECASILAHVGLHNKAKQDDGTL